MKHLIPFLFIIGSALAQTVHTPIPAQAGQNGKFLQTNGSTLTWAEATGDTVDNPTVNAAIAEDVIATRNTLNSPKSNIPPGAAFGGKFMATDQQTNPQVRALYFGDSITYPPDLQMRTLLGSGGFVSAANGGTLVAPAAAGGETNYSKSFLGNYINLSTGTVTLGQPDSATTPILATQIQVWYRSETGGGTFTVQYDTNGLGSYTTLTSSNSTIGGTGSITGGTGVVDAAEGGAGTLRFVTFTLANPTYVRVRCNGSGSVGSTKIIAMGGIEVPNGGVRLPGYVALDCSLFGTDITKWDDIYDADLATLITNWNPDFIYVRTYDDLGTYWPAWPAFAAKIRAIKPGIQFVMVGMHVTADNNHNVLDATDVFQQEWCDANQATFIPVRNRMGLIDWSINNYFVTRPGGSSIATVTGGDAGTGIITTSAAYTTDLPNAPGKYVRFESLTGGSNLKTGRAYRILTAPTATTLTLADIDGTTPVGLGSTVTAGTFNLIDGTHMSQTGSSFVANIVMEEMSQAVLPRMFLDGYAYSAAGWQRNTVLPSRLQPYPAARAWTFSGPSYVDRGIVVGRSDGGGTGTAYATTAKVGATANDYAYFAAHNGAGMAWTQSGAGQAILGNGSNSWTTGRFTGVASSPYGNVTDDLEIYTLASRAFAVSLNSSAAANDAVQLWRHGATSSAKGTEFARMNKGQGLVFHEVSQGLTLKVEGTNGKSGTSTMVAGIAKIYNQYAATSHQVITKTTHGGVAGSDYMTSLFSSTTPTFTTDHNADTLTITAHGLQTGIAVTVSNSGGGLPTPLLVSTTYYVRVVDANTLMLHSTHAGALANTGALFLTTNGTGTHTMNVTAGFNITSIDSTGSTVATDTSTFNWSLIGRQ